MERGLRIEVRWYDAQDHGDTWVDGKDALDFNEIDCIVQSIGYQISKGSKYLTLGSDWDSADQDYGTVRKIPISCILDITEIETKKAT